MALYPEDKRAGYLGLIAGTIALGALVYGIVHLTNLKFDGKEHGGGKAPAAAEGARH